MNMRPRVRKCVLVVHLTLSVGWIGTVLAYLALGIAASTSRDADTVRGAWIAMELTGWFVIVPLGFGSLFSGIVMAAGTRWGLLKHYWILISLVLTVVAVGVLLLHMPTVSSNADLVRNADAAQLDAIGADLAHPAVGLVLLLGIQVLNMYKPRGMTRYGQRKEGAERRPQASRAAEASLAP